MADNVAFSGLALGDLWKGRNLKKATGVQADVHLGKVLLGLYGRLEAKWCNTPGGAATFHTPERSLYPLIEDVLRSALPAAAIVESEIKLPRIAAVAQAPGTDISIRRMDAFQGTRLDDNDQSVFIEVKSVFHKEKLSDADILADLDKLVRCEEAYKAQCFFMLVGLPVELGKVNDASALKLTSSPEKRKITLTSGKPAWLELSARWVVGEAHIHVWAVSSNDNFPSRSNYYRYVMLQPPAG